MGDLQSQIASLDIGAQAIRRLAAKYGGDTLARACRHYLESSEAAMRDCIQRMPDGVYEVSVVAEDHADHIVAGVVNFTVGAMAGGSDSNGVPTTSDTDVSGGEGGSSSGGSDEGGSGSDGESVGTSKDDGGCRISPREGAPLGLLAPLVGLGLAWRARRRQR